MRGMNPQGEEEEATPSAGISSARYGCYPRPVMALVYVNLAHHELFTVLRALGSPSPTNDKPSAGTVLVFSDFGLKVEYVPFEQGSRTSHRQLKKPMLLDVPSDENM
jgi:hypothetical protein